MHLNLWNSLIGELMSEIILFIIGRGLNEMFWFHMPLFWQIWFRIVFLLSFSSLFTISLLLFILYTFSSYKMSPMTIFLRITCHKSKKLPKRRSNDIFCENKYFEKIFTQIFAKSRLFSRLFSAFFKFSLRYATFGPFFFWFMAEKSSKGHFLLAKSTCPFILRVFPTLFAVFLLQFE